jgi:TusA-related sulfurtransferase
MTTKQLREWLFQNSQDDQWWMSLDAVTEDCPVTVNEIEERLKSGQYGQALVLHVSHGEMAHPTWIEATITHPPQQRALPTTTQRSLPQAPTMIAPPAAVGSGSSSSSTESSWYYNTNGKRLGPVDIQQLRSLASQGVIDNATLIWHKSYGDWLSLGQSTHKIISSGPPPLPGAAVSNGLVWTVAFVPILGTLLQYFIAGMTDSAPSNLWFITLFLNILICAADYSVLKNAGHDTKKFGGWAWLVPVYLFKRAKSLNQGEGYFVTWMICFVIYLFL